MEEMKPQTHHAEVVPALGTSTGPHGRTHTHSGLSGPPAACSLHLNICATPPQMMGVQRAKNVAGVTARDQIKKKFRNTWEARMPR